MLAAGETIWWLIRLNDFSWRVEFSRYQKICLLGETDAHTHSVIHMLFGGAMKSKTPGVLKDGASCQVIGGTHKGKSGVVRDINTSKTGQVTITVVQSNGERFKTLAKNVAIKSDQ
jgi:hypothetical protein